MDKLELGEVQLRFAELVWHGRDLSVGVLRRQNGTVRGGDL